MSTDWWLYESTLQIVIDHQPFIMGFASGVRFTCLIHTLSSSFCVSGSVHAGRHASEEKFIVGTQTIASGDYLELEHHWKDICL